MTLLLFPTFLYTEDEKSMFHQVTSVKFLPDADHVPRDPVA